MEPAKADREYPLGEIIIKTGKESQEHMADTRTDELYRALQDKGYPDELCREIAYKHMNTDYTATRMLGYLYRVTSPRVEDVIDEMLAILSDREAIIRKKELEHAQATINSVYRVCNGNPGAVPVLAIRSTAAVPGFFDLILVHEQIPLGVQMLSSQKHFAEHYR